MRNNAIQPVPDRLRVVADTELVDDQQFSRAMAEPVAEMDPRWDRARELLATLRHSYIELGQEIQRLRGLYLGQSHGGARRGVSSFPNGKLENDKDTEKGFVAQLRAQLGISYKVSQTYLKYADYQAKLLALSNGEAVADKDGTAVEATPTRMKLAQEALETLSLTGAAPTRLWAGVMGGGATKHLDRAPVDHLAVWLRACTALSVANWQGCQGKQRLRAAESLVEALEKLPVEVRQEILNRLTGFAKG